MSEEVNVISERQKKWDFRYLDLAKTIATWSKDPSTQLGSVIVHPDFGIASLGFNGFPRGVRDTAERLNNREIKYKLVVHAEHNAIVFAQKSVAGCILYTHPLMPCARCAGTVIQAGITRVVSPFSDNPRWVDDFELSRQMFEEAGVELVLYRDYQG